MKSTIKKIGFWVCVVASCILVGNTVAGWVNDYKETHPATSTETAQVCVLAE